MMSHQEKILSSLLAGMVKDPSVITDMAISSISMDSREVDSGALFIATAKEPVQRQGHIQQAIEAGAKAILVDDSGSTALTQRTVQVITVKALDSKISEIAARFYGHPSLAQTVIAVTGTNGKTSVTQFIAQCLEASGQACGVIGTLGCGRIMTLVETGMTTPNPVAMQATLADFFHQSIKTVVIEASSHALEQGRLNSIAIDVAVLTNLSRDHLDYHRDMASYANAKKRLFQFDSVKTVVINAQDNFGQSLIEDLASNDNIRVMTYGQDSKTDLAANDANMTKQGVSFNLVHKAQSTQINSSLLGLFNIDNLLATAGSLMAIGRPFKQVIEGLAQCHAAKGRMEIFGGDQQTTVIVDFAHTPDALSKALLALQEHKSPQAELWCVFGCGGDRDTGKRPEMGAAAEEYADKIIITADNPRSENNEIIVEAILNGLENPQAAYIEHDRHQAIHYAIAHAKKEDLVLVAGKGHEQYQEISGVKKPYSDIETVITALKAANDAQAAIASVQL
jgi:UDP-N-acetylmuramoyl-L-alanyl-D-glutamate--2,6-diaminopimelate ligase